MSTPKASTEDGFVYILTSPNCSYIKIGGSAFPPAKRIKEINTTDPYRQFGPWYLHDFRGVKNWRSVEYNLHYVFRSKLVAEVKGQDELFLVSPYDAAIHLSKIDEAAIVGRPKIDRMFNDEHFLNYLVALFKISGLVHWLDIQGAWTFSLFPSTSGGRYFTLNIGPHEVAFSTLSRKPLQPQHMLYMDELVHNYPEIMKWVQDHCGEIESDSYATALSHAVSVWFEGDFTDALEFLSLEGVRRAIIAYWTERLVIMKDTDTLSAFSRFHNYNAVAEINRRIKAGAN